MAQRITKVCATCGSEDVRCDAFAVWNVELQEWELSATFDKGSVCEPCGGETTIIDESIEETTTDDPVSG